MAVNPPMGAVKQDSKDSWRRLKERPGVKVLDSAERRPVR
jgi:hypothetical protein